MKIMMNDPESGEWRTTNTARATNVSPRRPMMSDATCGMNDREGLTINY
jgi:hypothetical protein